MTAFFFGVAFGMIFAGSIAAAVYVTIKRPKQEDIEPWAEEAYQVPPVKTRILVNKREIEI